MFGLFSRVRGPVVCDDRLSHIAFIMDGNGRWARKRGLPREAGHARGARNLYRVMDACRARNVRIVTVYAFSTENWKRPQKEVDEIMKLLTSYLQSAYEDREKNETHVRVIGDTAALPEETQAMIDRLDRETAQYERVLNIALNYGGRQEIVHAVNTAIAAGKTTLTEQDISDALYTAPLPEPDLIIRTGGEMRLSNYLMWQSAYTELAFTKTLWPDFGAAELDEILKDFYKRHRRFGGL